MLGLIMSSNEVVPWDCLPPSSVKYVSLLYLEGNAIKIQLKQLLQRWVNIMN